MSAEDEASAELGPPVHTLSHTCPHCGETHNAASAVGGAGLDEPPRQPTPGSFMVCEDCGGLSIFVTASELKATDIADVPAEARETIRAAMTAAVAARGGRPPPAYYRAAKRLDHYVCAMIARGGIPRFALPPKGMALLAGMDELGHKVARNAAAHELVDAVLSPIANVQRMPTMVMLAAVLHVRGVPTDELSMEEMREMQLIAMRIGTERGQT